MTATRLPFTARLPILIVFIACAGGCGVDGDSDGVLASHNATVATTISQGSTATVPMVPDAHMQSMAERFQSNLAGLIYTGTATIIMTTSPSDAEQIRELLSQFPGVEVVVVEHSTQDLLDASKRVRALSDDPAIAGQWFSPHINERTNTVTVEIQNGYVTHEFESRIRAAAAPVDVEILEVLNVDPGQTDPEVLTP